MRIACISTSRVPSRTANAVQTMKVAQAYRALGHEVLLLVPQEGPPAPWSELAELYGLRHAFEIQWLPSARSLRRYDYALRAVAAGRRWGADLFHIWTLQAAAWASLRGMSCVLELHDRPPGRGGPLLLRAFLVGRGARRLLPITHALRAWLAAHYGQHIAEPFAQVAPMGVDLERYAGLPAPQEARRRLGLPEGFTAGYTGHLYPGRGMETLLALARANPGVQFLWVGGEPRDVDRWRRLVNAAELDNVRLTGFVPNQRLPLYQAACDVLLMPYQRRVSVSSGGDTAPFASPMKVFEYMAAGRAILSSDLPVLREVLSEANAILLPPEDPAAWDRALKALQADPARRAILAAQAGADARRYTWEARARRILQGLGSGEGEHEASHP